MLTLEVHSSSSSAVHACTCMCIEVPQAVDKIAICKKKQQFGDFQHCLIAKTGNCMHLYRLVGCEVVFIHNKIFVVALPK